METMCFDKPLFFRQEYKFKNKKERNSFFNKTLINNIYDYKIAVKFDFDERLHVLFSWMELTKHIAYIMLGLTFLAITRFNITFELILFFVSFISFVASQFIKSKINDVQLGKEFTISMLNLSNETLEEVRQELILKN
jgi:hypothetical protein